MVFCANQSLDRRQRACRVLSKETLHKYSSCFLFTRWTWYPIECFSYGIFVTGKGLRLRKLPFAAESETHYLVPYNRPSAKWFITLLLYDSGILNAGVSWPRIYLDGAFIQISSDINPMSTDFSRLLGESVAGSLSANFYCSSLTLSGKCQRLYINSRMPADPERVVHHW